jgi:hypothetical protein
VITQDEAQSKPDRLIELMELSADELFRRGEKLLKLSRELTAQAMRQASLAALPEERSTGRNGVVSEVQAIKTATTLRHFTPESYGEALGLKRAATMRWLAKLIERTPPIIERLPDGAYQYIDPSRPASGLRAPAPTRDRREHAGRAAGGPGGLSGTGVTLRGVPKEIQPLVRKALKDGWVLSRQAGGKGHWKLARNGETIGFATTPRNAGNQITYLRQALASRNSNRHD